MRYGNRGEGNGATGKRTSRTPMATTVQGRTMKKSYYYEVSVFRLRRRIDAILINNLAIA